MMQRPPHGATRRPEFDRPGSGYGRPVRPRPSAKWRDVTALASTRSWDDLESLIADANVIDITIDDRAINA